MVDTNTTTKTNGNGSAVPTGMTDESRRKLSESMKKAHAAKKGPWKSNGGHKAMKPSVTPGSAVPAPAEDAPKKRGRGMRPSPADIERMHQLLAAGNTIAVVAERLGFAKSTVYRHKGGILPRKGKRKGTTEIVAAELLRPRSGISERGVLTLKQARSHAYRLARKGHEFTTLELMFLLGQGLLMEMSDESDLP